MGGHAHILVGEGGHKQFTSSTVSTGGTATTNSAHGLVVNQPIMFSNKVGGTGLSTTTVYYVKTTPTSTTFTFATTPGGSAVTISTTASQVTVQVGVGWSTNATSTSGNELPWYLPAGPNAFHTQYDSLTFIISVIGTSGTAPSSWSIKGRFEEKLLHTTGFQRQMPIWTPFDTNAIAGRVAEQIGWCKADQTTPLDGSYGTIADSTDGLSSTVFAPYAGTSPMTTLSTRITVSRAVLVQGGGVRVALLPTITGGDSSTRIHGSAVVIGHSR